MLKREKKTTAAIGVLLLLAVLAGMVLPLPAPLGAGIAVVLAAAAAILGASMMFGSSEDKKSLEENAETPPEGKKDLEEPATPAKDEAIPLTAENLELLMPGEARLSQEDHERLDAIRREAHERMMERRRRKRTIHPRSAQEQRDRLLAYSVLPASVPTPPEDREAVPTGIFDFSGKRDPEKIKEELRNLEAVFPAYSSGDRKRPPSRFGPREDSLPMDQLARRYRDLARICGDPQARDSFLKLAEEAEGVMEEEKNNVARLAAQRHREKAETAPPDIAKIHIQLAEEYEAKLSKEETR